MCIASLHIKSLRRMRALAGYANPSGTWTRVRAKVQPLRTAFGVNCVCCSRIVDKQDQG
jgi:hypothetical protein